MKLSSIVYAATGTSALGAYIMFAKDLPLWGHGIVALFALATLGNSGANLISKLRQPKPTIEAKGGGVAVAGEGMSGTVKTQSIERPRVTATGEARATIAETYTDSSKTLKVDKRRFNLFNFNINISGMASKAYKGEVTTPDGITAKVTVHILWNDASWHFGKLTFNRPKLDQYLRTPEYITEMKSATAIACVGLASNWVDTKGTTFVPSLTKTTQIEIEDTTDNRAFTLCKILSERAREIQAKPQFFGLGLGYHVDKPADGTEEQKQRALVILHIEAGGTKRLTATQTKAVLLEVMKSEEILEFHGDRYSRVVDGRPICWSETVHGSFVAEDLRC